MAQATHNGKAWLFPCAADVGDMTILIGSCDSCGRFQQPKMKRHVDYLSPEVYLLQTTDTVC